MTSTVASLADRSAEKRQVALHSMTAAAAMTLLKLAAGLFSGSLGILSDAAHSALDLIGVTLTFFSVQVSDKPADEDHTYGHAKFENLSAFGEAGLMAISCAWIIWEAMNHCPPGGTAPLDLAGAGAADVDRGGLLALAAAARGG
jgi:cation diffusion facilitator family transporter